MGCDGGSIPRRDEMVKLKKKAQKVKIPRAPQSPPSGSLSLSLSLSLSHSLSRVGGQGRRTSGSLEILRSQWSGVETSRGGL